MPGASVNFTAKLVVPFLAGSATGGNRVEFTVNRICRTYQAPPQDSEADIEMRKNMKSTRILNILDA
ncbi:hypothetical protein Misp06_03097 [Microbulbifer sp. NBRC 101763]